MYAFKHPLTQEVAYGSQLGERRAAVHAAVAARDRRALPGPARRARGAPRAALGGRGETLEAARWHARAAEWAGRRIRPSRCGTGAACGSSRTRSRSPRRPSRSALTARNLILQYGWRLGSRPRRRRRCSPRPSGWPSKSGTCTHARSSSPATARSRASATAISSPPSSTRQATALAEESGDPALFMVMAGTNAYALFCIGEFRESLASSIARSSSRTAIQAGRRRDDRVPRRLLPRVQGASSSAMGSSRRRGASSREGEAAGA